MKIAVVGANGRVGRALVAHLADRYDVNPIVRQAGEGQAELVTRAVTGAEVVVNAAGVAHIERPTSEDVVRLREVNVDLPLALAGAALTAGASLIHISSVKAVSADSSYAQSKRDADEALERQFADGFAVRDLSLVVIRPLALLCPPLEAGKVARLRRLRGIPRPLVPPIPLPVLTELAFTSAVSEAIAEIANRTVRPGLLTIDFERSDWGTLRDVLQAHR